jgi:hypothetical protein
MYKGEPTEGIKFYNLLVESKEFTSELGKVALASGRLEAELILFLKRNGITGNFKKATLGSLIAIAEKNDLLDKNMIIALRQISEQRNYLAHNIYALFTDLIDETVLEKNNLLDSDVHLYIEKAWQLKENLDGLTDIIKQKNE